MISDREAQAVGMAMKIAEFVRKYAESYGRNVHDFKELYLDVRLDDKILEAVLLKFIFEDKPLESVLGFKDDQELFWYPHMTPKNSHFNLLEYWENGKLQNGKLYLYVRVPKAVEA